MAKKKEEVKEVKKPEPRDVKATAKTVRVTSRKAKLVLDLIRGKDVKEAMGRTRPSCRTCLCLRYRTS